MTDSWTNEQKNDWSHIPLYVHIKKFSFRLESEFSLEFCKDTGVGMIWGELLTTSKLLCSTYLKIKDICLLKALKFKDTAWILIIWRAFSLTLCIMLLLQAEQKAAGEKVGMFRELLRITQTDQVLKCYHLDTPTYLEMSRRGASLLLSLYTDLPVAKSSPSTYAALLPLTSKPA